MPRATITTTRPPTWRERAIAIRAAADTGTSVANAAATHGVKPSHAHRLLRIHAALGDKAMQSGALDAISVARIEQIAAMTPAARRRAIAAHSAQRPNWTPQVTLTANGREPKPSERAAIIEDMADHGMSKKDIAEHLGVDNSTITVWLRISRCIEPIRDAIDAGQIKPSVAAMMFNFSEREQAQIWSTHAADFLQLSFRKMRGMIEERYRERAARPEHKTVKKPTASVEA